MTGCSKIPMIENYVNQILQTEDRGVTHRVVHPLGRFSQKTKQKSLQGPPLARVMSLGDKEVKNA